jgi:hypothetical protein
VESIQRVSKTYLARNTRRVINEVQRGYTAVIESHGEPEVAVIDITDYYILRAVLRYHARQPEIDAQGGLADAAVAALDNSQARYDLVLAHYLAGAISLGRAAELLNLPWLDLRTRFLRLEVPLRTAPATLEEARADAETARAWGRPG